MNLEQFTKDLGKAFGPALRSVVLYGSAVAGEHIARKSDYNVLVVVDSLPLETLRAAAAVTKAWVTAGNPPPLIFTEEEWRGSADVFPMECADIAERHRILFGDDVVSGVRVDPEHLRLQVEQEARGKLVHLRQEIFGASANERAQLELLERTLSPLMVLYRGVARVHGHTPPTDYEELSNMVARGAGFDADAVLRVVRHVRGQQRLRPREAPEVLGRYLLALETLVRKLDKKKN